MTKTIDLRLTVDDGESVENVLTMIGANVFSVSEAVVLAGDGFGRLVPDEATRTYFTVPR